MKSNKELALGLGFVAAVAFGVWLGPYITQRESASDQIAPPSQVPQVSIDNHPSAPRAPATRRTTVKPVTVTAATRSPSGATPRTVPASAPALHEVLKPILNKGADMGIASREFVDAEQFATVAHAARNTDVPFMVLKHRVLVEGKSLEAAIHEFKPALNASVEAEHARAAAKSDISALVG